MLRAFTLRGRVLLCVGAAFGIGAVLLGERDLLRVGVFTLLIPVLSAVAVARMPRAVSHTRDLLPARVAAGEDARVRLRLTGGTPALRAGSLLIEDSLPVVLGEVPRYTIGRLPPGASREVTYRVHAQMRGRYPIGPLRLRFLDPLGCVQLERLVGSSVALLVTPPTVALGGSSPTGDSTDSGESRTRSMASAGDDDIVPRGYRHGDDLRRVHWRSTARHGELMVRREEHQWRDHSALLLDVREPAHAGSGPGSSMETAVSSAASVALHLLSLGQELRFATNDHEVTALGGADAVLDTLAVTRPSLSTSLHTGIDLLGHTAVTGQGMIVAVLGALRAAEAEALAQARGVRERRCVAVLCPTAAWTTPAARTEARHRLTRAGWVVLEPATVDALPRLWREHVTGAARGADAARSAAVPPRTGGTVS
ncbi:DUF58 domain-containing protein [Murinocardiopsis flavida]|uniref:DUF58 domain-containing protein n=1 Tax=Murinocardiopsis flavida TaxID=645275 RepID=UPI00147600AB|nr:DUF58 domain-containing protein [Murinocardiopsis flavida]